MPSSPGRCSKSASAVRGPDVPAFIFDLDGTLVDTRCDLVASVNRTLRVLGHPERSEAEVVRCIGRGARNLIRGCLPASARADASVDTVLAAFRADYAAHLVVRTRPYDGVVAALAALGAHGPLAVLTNKPGPLARSLLDQLGLASSFAAIFGPDDLGAYKPDPGGLLQTLERLGCAPAAAWYIGDLPLDVETARAAGCRAASVAWGLGDEASLRAARPDRLLLSPADLPSLLAVD